MNGLHPEQMKRLRGAVLRLLCARHNLQLERMDDVGLTHALRSLTFDIGINEAVTVLQDLNDRKYVRYTQKRDSLTVRVTLSQIECTAAGRDLVEETKTDPAVRF